MAALLIKVNGQSHTVDVLPDTPLLWVLRDHLRLTGTKFGSGIAQCGARTVFFDGQPLRSCSMPVSGVGASEITTIEGLAGRAGHHGLWVRRFSSGLPCTHDHEASRRVQ